MKYLWICSLCNAYQKNRKWILNSVKLLVTRSLIWILCWFYVHWKGNSYTRSGSENTCFSPCFSSFHNEDHKVCTDVYRTSTRHLYPWRLKWGYSENQHYQLSWRFLFKSLMSWNHKLIKIHFLGRVRVLHSCSVLDSGSDLYETSLISIVSHTSKSSFPWNIRSWFPVLKRRGLTFCRRTLSLMCHKWLESHFSTKDNVFPLVEIRFCFLHVDQDCTWTTIST